VTEALSAATLGPQVKELLEGDDLDALAAVLDLQVTWAAPDFPDDGCHNRKEVLAWWRRAYEAGVRAEVVRVEVHGDSLLVSLKVRGRPGGSSDRFQVLTVGPRGVTSIVGFDTRADALALLACN
jgi:hypothetical protein